jgi:hypothetical protein
LLADLRPVLIRVVAQHPTGAPPRPLLLATRRNRPGPQALAALATARREPVGRLGGDASAECAARGSGCPGSGGPPAVWAGGFGPPAAAAVAAVRLLRRTWGGARDSESRVARIRWGAARGKRPFDP